MKKSTTKDGISTFISLKIPSKTKEKFYYIFGLIKDYFWFMVLLGYLVSLGDPSTQG